MGSTRSYGSAHNEASSDGGVPGQAAKDLQRANPKNIISVQRALGAQRVFHITAPAMDGLVIDMSGSVMKRRFMFLALYGIILRRNSLTLSLGVSSGFINIQYQYEVVLILILNC